MLRELASRNGRAIGTAAASAFVNIGSHALKDPATIAAYLSADA